MDGWNTFDNFKLVIEQDEPLPLHIKALILEHNFNDRQKRIRETLELTKPLYIVFKMK